MAWFFAGPRAHTLDQRLLGHHGPQEVIGVGLQMVAQLFVVRLPVVGEVAQAAPGRVLVQRLVEELRGPVPGRVDCVDDAAPLQRAQLAHRQVGPGGRENRMRKPVGQARARQRDDSVGQHQPCQALCGPGQVGRALGAVGGGALACVGDDLLGPVRVVQAARIDLGLGESGAYTSKSMRRVSGRATTSRMGRPRTAARIRSPAVSARFWGDSSER